MLVGVHIANFGSEFYRTSFAEVDEGRELVVQACVTLGVHVHFWGLRFFLRYGCVRMNAPVMG